MKNWTKNLITATMQHMRQLKTLVVRDVQGLMYHIKVKEYFLCRSGYGLLIPLADGTMKENNTDSRDSEDAEVWWYGSTMIRQGGFIYFVDDDDIKVEDIKPGYCWFKARNVKYRVIPD